MTPLLTKGEICIQTRTQGERPMKMKAETHNEGTPNISRKTPELGERHGTDQKKPTLPTPWSQTRVLQNCEKIDLLFKAPVCGTLLQQP